MSTVDTQELTAYISSHYRGDATRRDASGKMLLMPNDVSLLGIAIPDLVFQSRDSGLALPGSRDPGIPEVPILS